MRMIDADKLKRELKDDYERNDMFYPEYHSEALRICRNIIDAQPTVSGWISIDERMPVETHSIFWRFSGTDTWSNSMWREQSDKVLVTVAFKDGTRLVTTGETHDGKWSTRISSTLEHTVTHWMPLPETPDEDAVR